jgi:hypothetical protein
MESVALGSLCEECQQLQIGRLFDRNDPEDGTTVEEIPIMRTWMPKGCRLCDFIIECLPTECRGRNVDGTRSIYTNTTSHHEFGDYPGFYLETWSVPPSKEEGNFGLLQMNISYRFTDGLKLSPIICIPSEQRELHGLEIPATTLDLTTISGWLKKEEIITKSCQYHSKGDRNSDIPLVVIDCATKLLVPLIENALYANLSYVWGPSQLPSTESDIGFLPSCLPATIQDSIDVCKELNIRYLWIDRYCISQTNQDLRKLQIRKMDRIYENSLLTIVACAGDDPTYGLPGMSRLRKTSPQIHISGLGCLQSLPGAEQIHLSTWATRGWTYQEVLLAKRQLYFTDYNAFFGSARNLRREARGSEVSLEGYLPVYERISQSSNRRIWESSEMIERKYSLSNLRIWDCIANYSNRRLSYQADVLDALLGILASYQRQHGIRHLWGLPYSSPSAESPQSEIWTFRDSLRWLNVHSGFRREDFPSWSWVGCNGNISHYVEKYQTAEDSAESKQEAMKIEVELKSGKILTWSQYQHDYSRLQDYSLAHHPYGGTDGLSHFIHIEVMTSQVIEVDVNDPVLHYASMDALMATGYSLEYVSPVEKLGCEDNVAHSGQVLPVGTLLALHFIQVDKKTNRESYEAGALHMFCNDGCALLVINVGEHWERVCLLASEHSLDRDIPKVQRRIRLG